MSEVLPRGQPRQRPRNNYRRVINLSVFPAPVVIRKKVVIGFVFFFFITLTDRLVGVTVRISTFVRSFLRVYDSVVGPAVSVEMYVRVYIAVDLSLFQCLLRRRNKKRKRFRLKNRGFSIAITNGGPGYASFSFPFVSRGERFFFFLLLQLQNAAN